SNPEDPYFDGDVIFCTYDQLLMSFLLHPLSLSLRTGNVNAGALLGSLLVIDEFHLYDQKRSFLTTLAMLKHLDKWSRFVIMTATMSDNMITKIKNTLNTTEIEVIDVNENKEFQNQNSNNNKRMKSYKWENKPLTAEHALKILKENAIINNDYRIIGKAIIVVNTVNKAQELYKKIKQVLKNSDDLLLLHSRFYPSHREKIEEQLNNIFGKKAEKDKGILISTQVIEVGVDYTCDILLTQLAPAPSIVQRAGRCARFGGIGKIYIFELDYKENSNKKNLNYAPYTKEDRKIIDETRNFLMVNANGKNFWNYKSEISFVHSSLEKIEQEFLEILSNHVKSLQNNLLDILIDKRKGGKGILYDKFVRHIDNINVISCSPDYIEEIIEQINIGNIEYIPVFKYSVLGKLKKLLKESQDIIYRKEPLGWYLELKSPDIEGQEIRFSKITFKASPIFLDDLEKLKFKSVIILNSHYFNYEKNLGLDLNIKYDENNNPKIPFPKKNGKNKRSLEYHRESWKEHAYNCLIQYKKLMKRRCSLISRLLGIDKRKKESFNIFFKKPLGQIFQLTIAFHDLGKTLKNWQDIARKVDPDFNLANELIAHPKNSQKLYNIRFPNHALEGAILSIDLINCLLENYTNISDNEKNKMLAASFLAIATHHGGTIPDTSRYDSVKPYKWFNKTIVKENIKEILKILLNSNQEKNNTFFFNTVELIFKEIIGNGLDIQLIRELKRDLYPPKPRNLEENYLPYYFALIRYLRFADWTSQLLLKE
ncbi:MAG: CRISPR-associated helicase Cas3', partial [Candidatus Helarchaeota archaeon]